MSQENYALPELLSPAGSTDALHAAIQAGADAVYFGGSMANARANAKNFSDEEMAYAINLLHENNRRAYITLNTLHTDRELNTPPLLNFIEHCCSCGADAFILQDVGLSGIIRRFFPDIKLHASTQMAGHSLNAAEELARLGFSRMVIARELDSANLENLIDKSPIEIEMFVHGALCSSHSGRCFMSFALGNTRSANRGMCAQPCRLKYNNKYLLSLKDLCLAQHIEKIIEMKPASLKIEGRMKPPEYVYHVTKIYRICLDEKRNATKKEIELLSQVFSRQGFTDGYYKRNLGAHMYGVRTDENKSQSNRFVATVPAYSENRHLPFTVNTTASISLKEMLAHKKNISSKPKLCLNFNSFEQFNFMSEFLLSDEIYNKIYKIFIPVMELTGKIKAVDRNLIKLLGMRFPYVIFDSEEYLLNLALENILNDVREYSDIKLSALIDNISHIKIAKNFNLELYGNYGLNITNSYSLDEFKKIGFTSVILSPELNFAQIRDINKTVKCGIIGYGRTHVMISENCLMKNAGLCNINTNDKNKSDMKCGIYYIEDRLSEKFAVTGDFGHRNIIFNSVPVYLADKKNLYRNLGLFFVALNFTDEKKECIENIISDYALDKDNIKPPQKFTRGYK